MAIEKYLRLAVIEDIPVLVRYAKHFHMSSPYKTMKFDFAKGEQFLTKIIQGPQTDGIVLVALHDGEPIGFIVGVANEPVFSSARIATELGWWVEPEHRGSKASALIYFAYEDWAKRTGCHYVHGAYLPGVSPDLDEFYKKRGYVQVETSFIKTLKFQALDIKGVL